jgi:hypothetical protein
MCHRRCCEKKSGQNSHPEIYGIEILRRIQSFFLFGSGRWSRYIIALTGSHKAAVPAEEAIATVNRHIVALPFTFSCLCISSNMTHKTPIPSSQTFPLYCNIMPLPLFGTTVTRRHKTKLQSTLEIIDVALEIARRDSCQRSRNTSLKSTQQNASRPPQQ